MMNNNECPKCGKETMNLIANIDSPIYECYYCGERIIIERPHESQFYIEL